MDNHTSDAAMGLAALTIAQNMLAVLMDRGVITREDVEELLLDAAQVDSTAADSEINAAAGDIVREVMEGLTARH